MSDKNTIAAQLLRAVAQQEIELAEERAAHLATRQELSMALAERAHARAEVERLREALRAIATCHPTGRDSLVMRAQAALAGAPSETRRPSASLALHDRALAERVRDMAAKACERIAMSESQYASNVADDCAEAVRALDLDALLDQGEP